RNCLGAVLWPVLYRKSDQMISVPSGSVAAVSLTQPISALAKPGSSITLDCVASGYNINDHHMHWMRQTQGKGLVWIAAFKTGDTTYISNDFKGCVTPSTSGSTARLKIDGLTAADTAAYYCARKFTPRGGRFPKRSVCPWNPNTSSGGPGLALQLRHRLPFRLRDGNCNRRLFQLVEAWRQRGLLAESLPGKSGHLVSVPGSSTEPECACDLSCLSFLSLVSLF
uniref:Ig-like domain-containing protein n=1 Tax=Chelydra serpentina TaxID=8475 RepID=A0A8C3SEP7_CHESE